MITLLFEFILLGLVGGLIGLFYRNCLKGENQMFNFIYYRWLKPWAEIKDDLWCNECINIKPRKIDRFKAWLAYPLGYCIYCNTTTITIILCMLYISSWEELPASREEMPASQNVIIGVIAAIGVQHLVVLVVSKYLMNKHPDFDNKI